MRYGHKYKPWALIWEGSAFPVQYVSNLTCLPYAGVLKCIRRNIGWSSRQKNVTYGMILPKSHTRYFLMGQIDDGHTQVTLHKCDWVIPGKIWAEQVCFPVTKVASVSLTALRSSLFAPGSSCWEDALFWGKCRVRAVMGERMDLVCGLWTSWTHRSLFFSGCKIITEQNNRATAPYLPQVVLKRVS